MEKKKISTSNLIFISVLLILSLTSGISHADNWWDKFGKPQYGGTFSIRMHALADNFDPAQPFGAGLVQYYWYEHMLSWDWSLDRDIWAFKAMWASPEYYEGMLMESWEWKDPETMIGKIRQGVHWQNKPPANGREFTAHDVEFHYDRVFGTGNGFTKPNPILSMWGGAIKKVTALDKYTVEIKFHGPSNYFNMSAITDVAPLNIIECPESVKSDIKDWKNAVGTGAFMLTDFVADSSMTLAKNPDYWRFDSRHPENRLPYVDEVKLICIPDMATTLAAIRSGKIDLADMIDWQQAQSLAKTNPELNQSNLPWMGTVYDMRIDRKPFDDIRVRKALQLAVDREQIAKSYFKGTVDGKPAGLISPLYKGWTTPYDEWPAELKEEYSYNPAKAKKLLAEAGYPDGFKTNIVAVSARDDLQLLQIIKAQLMDIGVDMEIRTMEPATADAFIKAKKQDQMATAHWVAFPRPPQISLADLDSSSVRNSTCNNDPKYDELFAKMRSTNEISDAMTATIAADMYALRQHWGVILFPSNNFVIWQPYLKGYSGENIGWNQDLFWSGLWVDQDLKQKSR